MKRGLAFVLFTSVASAGVPRSRSSRQLSNTRQRAISHHPQDGLANTNLTPRTADESFTDAFAKDFHELMRARGILELTRRDTIENCSDEVRHHLAETLTSASPTEELNMTIRPAEEHKEMFWIETETPSRRTYDARTKFRIESETGSREGVTSRWTESDVLARIRRFRAARWGSPAAEFYLGAPPDISDPNCCVLTTSVHGLKIAELDGKKMWWQKTMGNGLDRPTIDGMLPCYVEQTLHAVEGESKTLPRTLLTTCRAKVQQILDRQKIFLEKRVVPGRQDEWEEVNVDVRVI